MAKADKSTAMQRTQDVLRILLAGGEFAEIRQFASDRGWNLSERQLRRYQERAYKQLARATRRNQQHLLGRHLTQRRALYARALKAGDIRTALQVLRNEANLEGLYPPTKIAPTTPDGQQLFQGPQSGPQLTRLQRFKRLLKAEENQDETELQLLKQITPHLVYRLPDTMMPLQMLYVCTMTYVAEQLDHGAMVFVALWEQMSNPDSSSSWDIVGLCHAYRFKIGTEAWQRFTASLGVDPQKLVLANHSGSFLELLENRVCELAPSTEEITNILQEQGQRADGLPTVEGMAREWQRLLRQTLYD